MRYQVDTKETENFSWLDLWKAVLYFLKGYEVSFITWFTILFVVFFWGVIPPLIIAKIIDILTIDTSVESLKLVIGIVIALGTAHGIVSIIRLSAKNKLGDLQAEATYQIRVKGFERLVDMSLRWHDKENTGNKVQKIQNGAQGIRDLREMMAQMGIQTITQIIGIFAVFLFLQPFFGIFLFVYLAVFFSIHLGFYGQMKKLNDDWNISQETASGTYYEGVNNILTIKTLGVKDTFKTSVFANEQVTKDFSIKMRKIGIFKWKVFQVFNALSMIVYLSFVAWGVSIQTITVGQIIVFYTYLNSLMDAAGNSTDLFDRLIQNKSAVARMMPIYWKKVKQSGGTALFPTAWKTLNIRKGDLNLHKSGKGLRLKRLELSNLNLTIRRGEKIGIAGLSGGGKSTFAKLLMGLYELEKGMYKIDNMNFYTVDTVEVTNHIALVLQESEMFNMSLKDNITLLRNVDSKLLANAIRIAQLEGVIRKLPQGLDTMIGEKGHRLSGGERQRIGIARAICKDPDIFIFDESTSSLDSKTESLVQNALETELVGKTVLIIAHRITTLRNTDRILVFEKGRIVEEGTYDALLQDENSKFNEVSRLQKKK